MLMHTALLEEVKAFEEVKKSEKHKCPLCSTERSYKDCECDHHVVYAYRLKEEKTLRLFNKSRQRGGAARMLHTSLAEHKQNTRDEFSDDQDDDPSTFRNKDESAITDREVDQPEFGILLISPTNFYFFKERPDRWQDHTDKTNPHQLSQMFKQGKPDQKHNKSQDDGHKANSDS